MPYYADLDPENAVDLKSYNETLGQLLGEWHENDTDAVAAAMADYWTGPQDQLAAAKLVVAIVSRTQSILSRAEESRQTGAPE